MDAPHQSPSTTNPHSVTNTVVEDSNATTSPNQLIKAAEKSPSDKDAIQPRSSLPANEDADKAAYPRDIRFWLIFVAICSSTLLAALDLGGVGTAAPTIVASLDGGDFSWVAAAYNLSSAACLPLSGNLAQIFGRKFILLGALVVFAAGSAVSGAAPTMTVLIVGRAVQGVGGGGIQALTSIVISDLVPLRERGLFTGITGMMWTLGSIIGPFVAGSLAEKASSTIGGHFVDGWRWLFYMNLPLCLLAFVNVSVFLKVHRPRGDVWAKLKTVDWLGNALIISSTTSTMIALTWGGVRFSWSSYHVLVPLLIGFAGMVASVAYQWSGWVERPTIPKVITSNRTSFFGYVATFFQGMVSIGVGFYLPTWFQSVRAASPLKSGLLFLPMSATISPSAIFQGLLVARTGKYRLVNMAGWAFMILGTGLLISMRASTPFGAIAVYQLVQGLGMGLLYATTFTVLAPLPITENAAAISLLTFLRAFSQAWGISISGTILQNELLKRLPAAVFEAPYLDGADSDDLAYTLIPLIPDMPPALHDETVHAFQESMRMIWIVLCVLSGVGALTLLGVKDVELSRGTDGRWGPKSRVKTAEPKVEEGSDISGDQTNDVQVLTTDATKEQTQSDPEKVDVVDVGAKE
ncbi:MFS general substrate transporter [Fistulina hepatica ATCC 64428]|uniref:MFS general substrate transporter n=1 Tax=Fistulina hepatica ATCC 64428 TaxID=1128425 RepID=A0A0D7A5K3_9AGAR|nr:MFS general substrate transporter [Fistulina hepatica ATCC 64428]